MKSKLIRCGLLLCITATSATTWAAYSPASGHARSTSKMSDLLDIYWKAVNNDPTLKGASASKRSNEEAIWQARANFFPIIAAQGGQSAFRNVEVTANGAPTQRTNRNASVYQVSITQPVFNWSHWVQLGQAKAVVKQADASYDAALQDLMIRTAAAYFAVLQAKDTLRFTVAELKANERQLDQAKQRYKVGLDAITSVYDAQAAYDSVMANVITARNDVINAIEALREITGSYDKNLAPLRENFPLKPPEPNSPSRWVEQALKRNATLQATTHETEAARYGVKLARADHIPALNVVASYGDNRSSQVGNNLFDTTTSLVNLEVDVPIFQGGAVMSRTRQAFYDYENSQAKLDGTQKSVVSTTYQLFNSVINGISTIKADKQTVKSVNSSLESTEAAFKVGTRTIVDVLDRQKDLYDSERKLAADQYKYINDLLSLRESAGTITEKDLESINAWLKSKHKLNSMARFRARPAVPGQVGADRKVKKTKIKKTPAKMKDRKLYHTQRDIQVPLRHKKVATAPYRKSTTVATAHKVKPIHHKYLAPKATHGTVTVSRQPRARIAARSTRRFAKPSAVKQTVKPTQSVTVAKQAKTPVATKPVRSHFALDAAPASTIVPAPKPRLVAKPRPAKRKVLVVDAQPVGDGELNRPELYQSGAQQQEIHIAKHLEQANVPAKKAASHARRSAQLARTPRSAAPHKPKQSSHSKTTVRQAKKTSTQTRRTAHAAPHHFFLQVAAFKHIENAEHLAKRLTNAVQESIQLKESHRKNGTTMYNVRIGPIADANELYRVQETVSSKGFGDAIVQLH